MIGLMIIQAAIGSAVQGRRYQSGTTTRGVEAHLLQALMGWACLAKTRLRIKVAIRTSNGFERIEATDRSIPEMISVSEAQTRRDRQRPGSARWAQDAAQRVLAGPAGARPADAGPKAKIRRP